MLTLCFRTSSTKTWYVLTVRYVSFLCSSQSSASCTNFQSSLDIALDFEKNDILWFEFRIASNKTERVAILNIAYNSSNVNKTELLPELSQLIDLHNQLTLK